MTTMNGARSYDAASRPRIGIIGAGLAGLRCAAILVEQDFEVTIIEGRDRIGGRVHQIQLPNSHFVDLGPNWIHGTDDNPILDLAKETGTVYGNWDTSSNIFDETGVLFSQEDGEAYADTVWGIIQDAFAFSNSSCPNIDPKQSLLDFFKQKVIEKIPESKPNFKKQRHVILQMSEMWGAFVGRPIATQSLKYFWLEECIEGENLFCAGTYKKILAHVAKPAQEKARIFKDTTVSEIHYGSAAEDKVRLRTTSGAVFEFDEVVSTTPLGWLKRNKAAFKPALPANLSRAIDAIGYGCLEKVYLSFSEAFWRGKGQKSDSVGGFVQWIAPNYDSENNPAKWNQELVELASIDSSTAHPTLLFYIFGEQSQYITSSLVKMSTEEQKDAFLYNFFRPYYSRLPNYSETDPDCQPTGSLATTWLQDELAGNGSYCNFQTGLENGDVAIETMRKGLPDERLWFAGEHTAPFVALGTTTGAYWSGESVGKRILEAYGRPLKLAPIMTK